MITLSQLSNARALQKYGSFRRAAEAQHLSQPAFSRSIQKLESSLGVLLFDRQSTGIEPTIYGEALLKRAAKVILETAEIERETHLLQDVDIGNISIALGFYAAEIVGWGAIANMVNHYPNLHYQATVRDWYDVEAMVIDRHVDIGFAGINHIKEQSQLKIIPVGVHDFVFYCRKGHPLLTLDTLSKSDLDHYPVATVRLPPQMAYIFPGKTYIDKESGELSPSINVGDPSAARMIVAASDAIAVATPVQIEAGLHSGEFEILNFRAPWMKVDYGFIYRQDRMLAPAATLFMDYIRENEIKVSQRNHEIINKWFPND